MRSYCVKWLVPLMLVLIIFSGCSESGSDSTVEPSACAIDEVILDPAILACETDLAAIENALYAYYNSNGEWPVVADSDGDIAWEKLVPGYLSGTPATDAECDWRVNSNPEGRACIFDRGEKILDCYCAPVCWEEPENSVPTPIPSVTPSPTPTPAPISSMQTTGEIVWVVDWDDALLKAKNEGKPVFVSFYYDTCPYCKRIYSDVYADEEFGRFIMDNFVPIKINTRASTIDNDYEVKSVPTTAFVNSDGEEYPDARIIGAKTLDVMRTLVEEFLAGL